VDQDYYIDKKSTGLELLDKVRGEQNAAAFELV
jgi:hypothetical protein